MQHKLACNGEHLPAPSYVAETKTKKSSLGLYGIALRTDVFIVIATIPMDLFLQKHVVVV